MSFIQIVLVFTSTLLLVDSLFALYYFKFTYFLELKQRYVSQKNIPILYKNKLVREIQNDFGISRRIVQTLYLPWFFICLFNGLWILPIIVSIVIVFTNLFHKNAYISPFALFFNLIVSIMVYGYTLWVIFIRFV